MNKKILVLIIIILISAILLPGSVLAREGIVGYEGGISSGEVPGKTTLDYQEVTFVTGKPVVFKGTLTLKKSQKQNKLTTTYTYNLRSAETEGVLTRVLVFETTSVTMQNGQISESTELISARENLNIGGTTYIIANRNSYEFALSNLIDPKPAIQYHAGSVWSKKTYTVGTATSGNTVTVECTGSFYGYDQYWGNAESLLLDYIITAEKSGENDADKWGGTASVAISSTSAEKLEYQRNRPDQISFAGSYVQSRMNSNVMEYTALKLKPFLRKGDCLLLTQPI
jgi:N-acetylmuramoyl-L-alanine amidase